jgi:sensor histidine kinase YesM
VDEANSYLSKFSKLQRMILSYCDQNFIMLDKEIDMLQLYLEIEQLRLSHEFTFDITVDEEIEPEEIPIPPMMLQPFVENAIWHGLLPKAGEKKISIHFGLKGNDTLHCTVEDNGIGRKAAQKIKEEKLLDKTVNRSKGMSLVNSRMEILEKKYGQTFSVTITDKQNTAGDGTGTIVEVFIPVVD